MKLKEMVQFNKPQAVSQIQDMFDKLMWNRERFPRVKELFGRFNLEVAHDISPDLLHRMLLQQEPRTISRIHRNMQRIVAEA